MLPATRVKLEPEGEGSWRLWPLTTCEARHRPKLDPEGAGAFRPLKSVSPENRGASAPGSFPPMRPRSAAPTYLISTTFRALSKVSASTARTLLP